MSEGGPLRGTSEPLFLATQLDNLFAKTGHYRITMSPNSVRFLEIKEAKTRKTVPFPH